MFHAVDATAAGRWYFSRLCWRSICGSSTPFQTPTEFWTCGGAQAGGAGGRLRPLRHRASPAGSGEKGLPEQRYGRALSIPFNVTMGFCSVAAYGKGEGSQVGCPSTEYLTAVLLKVRDRRQAAPGAPPGRSRWLWPLTYHPCGNWFPSETPALSSSRFALHRPLSGNVYTFEEIVSRVHHFLRLNINRQQMLAASSPGMWKYFSQSGCLNRPHPAEEPSVMSLSYSWQGVTLPYSGTQPTRAPSRAGGDGSHIPP